MLNVGSEAQSHWGETDTVVDRPLSFPSRSVQPLVDLIDANGAPQTTSNGINKNKTNLK